MNKNRRQTTDDGRRPARRSPGGEDGMAGVVRNAASANPSAAVATKRINRLRNASSLTAGSLEQTNPLRGLTLARAVTLMESTLRGEFAIPQWTLWHVAQTDPDLFALESRRTSALMEMDWVIKVADLKPRISGIELKSSKIDEKLAAEQASALLEAYNAIENLNEAIEDMSSAFITGFSIAQFESNAESDQSSGITRLGVYDPWNIVRRNLKGDFYFNADGRAITWQTLGEANRIDPANHLIYTPRKNLMRIALYKFIRMNLSQKDWDAFIEIYGLPASYIIMPPNVPADKEAAYEAAALEAAEGGGGALPNGSDIKFANEARGVNPFRDHLAWLQQQLILAGTGGLLTMLSMPTGIGAGPSDQHEDTFKTIARGEAKKISEVFQKQFDKMILKAAFPGRPVLAYFELASREEQDIGEIITHALNLSQAGYQLDPAELSEKTGYKITLANQIISRAGFDPSSAVRPLPSDSPAGVAQTLTDPLRLGSEAPTQAAHLRSNAPAGLPSVVPGAKDGPVLNRGGRVQPPAEPSSPAIADPAIAGPAIAGPDGAAGTPRPTSISAAVAETLDIRADLIAPFFAELEAKAADKTLTDAELADAIEAMANALPELMNATSIQATAKTIEPVLAAAVVEGIEVGQTPDDGRQTTEDGGRTTDDGRQPARRSPWGEDGTPDRAKNQ